MLPATPTLKTIRSIATRYLRCLLMAQIHLCIVRYALAILVLIACATGGWVFYHRETRWTPHESDFHFSPYLDINLAIEGGLPLAGTFFSAGVPSIIPASISQPPTGIQALTLAFATGECGQEHWGPLEAQKIAQANVSALQRAGIGYRIATGGADGVFTCSSQAGMDAFIRRYRSTHLQGFDFDIEGHTSATIIQNLVQQVSSAAQRYPELRFGFTLTADVAGFGSLTPTGHRVMKAIAHPTMHRYFINLMVMNYGEADLGNCVVRSDQCDMTATAILAVRNLTRDYHIQPEHIEITPMIGMNDVPSNVFTLDDANHLALFAKRQHLGGLHFWSLNRDAPCTAITTAASVQVSARCHGQAQTPALAYVQAFAKALAVTEKHHPPPAGNDP